MIVFQAGAAGVRVKRATGASRSGRSNWDINPLRRQAWLLAACLFFQALFLPLRAEPILLRPATNLLANGGLLDPGTFSIPCVADWNGDGRKDLIVGYRTEDKLALYVNSGSDAAPVFAAFSNLQYSYLGGGVDIVVPGSPSCGAPAPWVCDYDGDGKLDLLVGSGADGSVRLFRNTGTATAPRLAAETVVVSSAAGVGSRATPYAHDWDEDGRCDLLSGDINGYVWLFRNTNSPGAPRYDAKVKVKAGGADLQIGLRSVVRMFDWDGDGLKDLVGSSSTRVYWCRNTNRNTDPVFDAAVALQAPVPAGGLANIADSPAGTPRMRLDLADWNSDGVMDAIVGLSSGQVVLYPGYRLGLEARSCPNQWFGLASPPCSQQDQVVLRWGSARYLTYTVLGGSDLANLNAVLASNVPGGPVFTLWTNRPQTTPQFYRVRTP